MASRRGGRVLTDFESIDRPMLGPPERRAARRVQVETPVLAARPGPAGRGGQTRFGSSTNSETHVHRATVSGSLLFCAEATDLSERGLRLLTPWSLPPRSRIQLTMLIPCRDGSREECILPAEVVRCDREQLAVAFPRLRPRQLLRLRDYVWRSGRSEPETIPAELAFGQT